MNKQINSPIKYHGGKYFLIKDLLKIIQFREVYVEPFLGGGNILINSPKHMKKYAFDRDELLINTWKVIRDQPNMLYSRLKNINYCEKNFNYAAEYIGKIGSGYDSLEAAAQYLVRNRFSRAGLNKHYGWSDRQRRRMPEYISAWQTMLYNLHNVSDAIQGVVFEAGCCRDLMRKYALLDNPSAVVYCDPPYVSSSRTAKKVYDYEMKTYDKEVDYPEIELTHEGVWKMIKSAQCQFYISGYLNSAYAKFSRDINYGIVYSKEIANHSGQNKVKQKRVEIVWGPV